MLLVKSPSTSGFELRPRAWYLETVPPSYAVFLNDRKKTPLAINISRIKGNIALYNGYFKENRDTL